MPASSMSALTMAVLESIIKLTDGSKVVSLSTINRLLPSDFACEEMDYLWEALYERTITVVDDLNDNQNVEPFLRKGELSKSLAPIFDDVDDRNIESELLLNPLKSWLRNLSSREETGISTQKRERLIETHLGLVVKIARRYKRSGVPLMELILAGNEGLVEAACHFDPSKDTKFSSVARWWIGHHLSRCIAENWRASRIPRTVAVNLRRIARVVARYRGKRGVDPSVDFLSRALAIDVDEVYFLKGLFDSPLSLHGPASNDTTDVELVETIADAKAFNGDAIAQMVNQRQIILNLMLHLDKLHRQVMSLRYGLDDGVTKSVSEVAGLLAISADEVCQIETDSLNKLRKISAERSFGE